MCISHKFLLDDCKYVKEAFSMNKKFSKIFIAIMIIISIFMLSACTPQYPPDTSVNLKGANHYWLVFLTIFVPHYSELIIQPFNEDFVIPDEINVDIVINNKRLFTGKLRYIPDPKFKFGQYKIELKSDDFYKKYKNQKYTVIIKYDNKRSSVLLNQCEIY